MSCLGNGFIVRQQGVQNVANLEVEYIRCPIVDYCYWGRGPSSWEVLGPQPLSNFFTGQYVWTDPPA